MTLNFDENCPFCSIARGRSRTAQILRAGPTWLAMFPLEPATPGHTLVLPKTHVVDLWEVSPSLGSDLMQAVITVGRAIESALTPEGMNLITSSGRVAEQSVFHLHLHLVPRWRQDGFGRIWPHDSKYEAGDLGDVAGRIREALAEGASA